jgi:predicted nucleotidyltransferase
MALPKIIEKNFNKLIEICHQFGVARIYAFGSVITNQFDPERSDLDFVVEMEDMPPLNRGENLIGLWEALEDLFAKKVDLITDQPIKNPYLRTSINKTKQLIYDRESEKIFS